MRAILMSLLAATTLLFLADSMSASGVGNTVTITDGGAPGWVRFDDSGNGVDAHDGEIKQFSYVAGVNGQAKYYLYGTSYGCGYVRGRGSRTDLDRVTPFCGFVAYESTDLRHWTYDGPLFDPNGKSPTDWQRICNSATLSCYRPHVLYDYATGYYRLWVNTYEVAADGLQHGYHSLKSRNPTGPFTEDVTASGRPVLPRLAFGSGGDFDLFQDSNQVGYVVYTVRHDPLGRPFTYKLVIERLSPEYTNGTGDYTSLDTRHTEAPSLFRRGENYYITMADPYCAYCAGTGTAYLRSTAPLGPWRGAGGQVAATTRRLYVDGVSALFTGAAPGTKRRLQRLRDYDFRFRAQPLPGTGAGRHDARVGWTVRASSRRTGYRLILSNRASTTAPTRLYREVLQNGVVSTRRARPVPVKLSSTSMNRIRTTLKGSTIRTWLNGTLIDTTRDTHFRSGFAGLSEPRGYSAYFDDVSLNPPSGALHRGPVLADRFTHGSLANFPFFDRYRRHGLRISSTSCGGQPDDVAMLRAPDPLGWSYLYQSDRWDNGDQNEAQATQYWEPLGFNPDGGIRALMCGTIHQTVLTDATPSVTDLDIGQSGSDGFVVAQDISSTRSRGQTFQITHDANLVSVQLTLFQGDDTARDAPNADLTVAVYDIGSDPTLTGKPLAQSTVPRDSVGWAPRSITVRLPAPLVPNADGTGHQYAIVLQTSSTTGVFGTARSDGTADSYTDGTGLVGAVDPSAHTTTWKGETAIDLRFALTMATSDQ